MLGARISQQRIDRLSAGSPACPILLICKGCFQLGIMYNPAFFQINRDHLTRPQAATFGNFGFIYMHHARLRTRYQQAICCMGIPHWPQTVAVCPANDPIPEMCGDCSGAIPWLHHRIAIGVKLGKFAIAAYIHRLRDHHGFYHWQATSALQQQLKHRIQRRRIRCTLFDNWLDVIDAISKNFMFHPVFMAGHPIAIAAQGINLAIMGKNTERLCQLPSWKSVGGITLMIDGKV